MYNTHFMYNAMIFVSHEPVTEKPKELEMWANAQRDSHPAEYRWSPLFNATEFGWRPLLDAMQ